jgi:hypothetical protein
MEFLFSIDVMILMIVYDMSFSSLIGERMWH